MTVELFGVYFDNTVKPWTPIVGAEIRAYATTAGTLEGRDNTDSNGRFRLTSLTDRDDWVPVASKVGGVIMLEALDAATVVVMLSDQDVAVDTLEASGLVAVDGEAINVIDDYDAVVDQDYSGSSPTVYSTLQDAIDADQDHVSIWIKNAGDLSAVTIGASDGVQRIQGKDADTTIFPVDLTVDKADVTIEQLGFDSATFTFSGARQVLRDCLFTASAQLVFDSGASLGAAERCRFQDNTGIPVVIEAGGSSFLMDRPVFLTLTATVDHCIEIQGAFNRLFVDKGLFLTVGDQYHVASALAGSSLTQSKFTNCVFLLNAAMGGVNLIGSRNVLRGCEFICLATPGGNVPLRVQPPAGTNLDTEVSHCSFLAFATSDSMNTVAGAAGDQQGLVFEHCKAPAGGVFDGGQDTQWYENDFRLGTIDFQSATGQRVIGGDLTSTTLSNPNADTIVRSVNGQDDRGDYIPVDSTYDLGSDANRFAELWLSSNADIEGNLQLDGNMTVDGTVDGVNVAGHTAGSADQHAAADVTYVPAVAADRDGSADPGDVDDALDYTAAADVLARDVAAAAFNGTSVVLGCAVTESSPVAQTVDVAQGIVRINGGRIGVAAQADVSVSAADATNPRRDLISINTSSTVVVTAGTPAAAPAFPAVPSNQALLATLYVAANDNTHANAQITDRRIIIQPGAVDLADALVASNQTMGVVSVREGTGAMIGFGMLGTLVHVDNASTVVSSDDGYSFRQDTAASSGSEATTASPGSGFPAVRPRNDPVVRVGFRLSATTDVRFFAGMTNQSASVMVSADDPAGNYVGIQYSTPRGDSNWQIVTKDNTTQNVQDSGLAVDTNKHFVLITVNDTEGEIIVQILDEDFQGEASVTLTANLTTRTAAQHLVSGIEARAAAVKQIHQYGIYVVQKG